MSRRPPSVTHIAITCADDSVAIMAFVTTEYNADGTIRWTRSSDVININSEISRICTFNEQGVCTLGNEKVPIKSWRPLNPNTIPSDRTYRNALVDVSGSLTHSMPLVKKIAIDLVREQRTQRLSQLDVDWMRAIGQNKQVEANVVEVQRQILRDRPAVLATILRGAETPAQVTALATLE